MHFDRNEENPLDADVIIIDENVYGGHKPDAIPCCGPSNVGTRLILVGDVDQLPSVGPGNVLRDIIDSGCFNVVKLTNIFRQAAQSDIVVNAHKINAGERVDLAKRSNDFLFIRRDNPDAVISAAITLIQQKLPGYVHAQPFDIQVMTPMRKGALGVERLNQAIEDSRDASYEGELRSVYEAFMNNHYKDYWLSGRVRGYLNTKYTKDKSFSSTVFWYLDDPEKLNGEVYNASAGGSYHQIDTYWKEDHETVKNMPRP